MKPLSELDPRGVRAVLVDIDETLTTAGKLTGEAFMALERLKAAGLIIVPVTGRPAGWCDHIARMWPVDAVVGENGAFYMRYDAVRRNLVRRFVVPEAERDAQRSRIEALGRRIIAAVPGSAMASDQHYRETDLAIDYCEDVPRLPAPAVAKIVALMREAGMTAKVSSIHVNGWFGAYDKLAMTRALMRECFDIDLDAKKSEFVFVGDSPNDAPLFGYFPHAVGVANVMEFAGQLAALPAYVTQGASGAGFCEVTDFLLAGR